MILQMSPAHILLRTIKNTVLGKTENIRYYLLLVKSTYINKEGKEKDILTYGILDVANKKYICYTANIDVAQRLERDWEFYNQITNPDFPDDPNRRLVCNSYTKKD